VKTSESLFSKGSTLFGNQPVKVSGVFGGAKSLFNKEEQKTSFVNSNQKEEEDDDDEPAEAEEKTFYAVSKDPHVKIFNKPIEKFQKISGSIGSGNLSIEKSNDEEKKFAFLVFWNGVGKTLFSG